MKRPPRERTQTLIRTSLSKASPQAVPTHHQQDGAINKMVAPSTIIRDNDDDSAVVSAMDTTEMQILTQRELLSNHSQYDDIRTINAGLLRREGTVDVLTIPESSDRGAEETELALCHLTAMWRYSTLEQDPATGELVPRSLGSGFYGDSSSVLMAVHHFNNGMGVVVDEIEGIHERCNLRFTIDFFDTYSSIPHTIETMTNLMNSEAPPCAVLGAFRSAVSTPLSILTGVYGLPQLSPVSSSPELDNTDLHPLFSRLVPSDAGTSLLTAKYFLDLGVSHVGVIFVNDAYGNAYSKAFRRIGESLGLTIESFSIGFKPSLGEIRDVIGGLAATRYRYFFGIIFGPEHYDLVMEEAYRQGISGRGNTLWIFGGGVQRYVQNVRYKAGSHLAKATQGTGMIQADGGIDGMPGYDRYLKAWKTLNANDVAYFNSKQPVGYYTADADYFKKNDPERESIFAYDAVTALGLAACKLLENITDGTYFEGKDHFDEFVRTSFVGASGMVRIDPETTSREPESALYVIFNALANDVDEQGYVSFRVNPAVIHHSAGDGWQSVKGSPFVFNDNTMNPPMPLPHLSVDMNYIGTGLRTVGLFLSSVAILTSIGFSVWTLQNRDTRIVRASQPIFCVMICVGCLFMGCSIIPLSIDDEVASIQGCNIACMAVPWLYTIGFATSYAALFSKTWRVNKLLDKRTIRRVKVSAWDVMLPFICLLCANIVVLALWTSFSPLQWQRKNRTGKDEFGRFLESYAGCTVGSDTEHVPYILTLTFMNAGMLVFANLQAYRARIIHTEFSESRYIWIAMASMLQCWAIGIPLMFVVANDPRAMYLVITSIIVVGCMAILCLIMVPKFLMRKKVGQRSILRSSSRSGLNVFGEADEIQEKEVSLNSGPVSHSTSLEQNGAEMPISDPGVLVVPHIAEKQNVLLRARLQNIERDKNDLLERMRSLLDTTENDGIENNLEDGIRRIIDRYEDVMA